MKVQLGAVASPAVPASLRPERNWRTAVRALRRCAHIFRNDALSTTFPDDCRICAGPLTAWSPAPVCPLCIEAAAAPQTSPLCSVCGEQLGLESARFAASLGITSCAACRLAPPPFVRAAACGAYEDQLRELIHLLKYDGIRALAAEPLGRLLAATIASLHLHATAPLVIIAVPLFPARVQRRGFNQSVLLADAAIAHLRRTHPQWRLAPAHTALRRTRDTQEQFALDPRQRRSNLKGAFAVTDVSLVDGKDVLLVDDILTTGATARECARVLLQAGATNVWVATVARAQPTDFHRHDHDSAVARWDAPSPQHLRTT